MKTLGGRRAAWVAAWLVAFLIAGRLDGRADLIPSAPVATSSPGAAHAAVAARLEAAGLTPAEAHDRVLQMREEDLASLADNPDQVQVAGAIGLGVALIAIGVIAFVILWLIGTEKIKL